MTTSPRASRRTTALLAAALGLAATLSTLTACTSATGTRAGGEPPPVTLRIGTDDPEGRPGSDQIEEFARQVSALSDGRMVVEPVFRAAGEDIPAWDQEVARMVVSGELDLGMVPARAWDTEGVTTLRALHAPFLVDDDETLRAVVSDDELAAGLLAGLEEVGITGLALLPEGLRHLFLYDAGELTLESFDGAVIRSPRSATSWAILEALGAEPTDRNTEEAAMDGVETAFALASTLPSATAVVGNLTFYPKVNSLVANTERIESLEEEHRQVLREAAGATRDWAVDRVVDDAAQALEYCEAGGTVVLADAHELARVQRATEPVVADLRSDPGTARLMDRIASLDVAATADTVRACDGSAPVTAETMRPDGGNLPDGTYRVEFTDAYLKSFDLSPEAVANNHGVWTIDLQDGLWSVHQVAPALDDRFSNIYQVDRDEVVWRFDEGETPVLLRWRVDGRGDLSLRFVDGPADARFHFGLPWRRVE